MFTKKKYPFNFCSKNNSFRLQVWAQKQQNFNSLIFDLQQSCKIATLLKTPLISSFLPFSNAFDYKKVRTKSTIFSLKSYSFDPQVPNFIVKPKENNLASQINRKVKFQFPVKSRSQHYSSNSYFEERENTQNYFFNRPFDKNRLKALISWAVFSFGENKTIALVENLKSIGYSYATKAGISLSIDDLKIPSSKKDFLTQADSLLEFTNHEVNKGHLTSIEYFSKVIETWNKTSESLKDEVIANFKKTDELNPVFLMAFSGARGNMSQVRQLTSMRGLMSDPQGKIINFPIQSNFREGLTLTEYIISCYGARKGVVDTALRTATSGYLTRRLVDVAQHVIIRGFNCGTKKGIYLADLKKGTKTLLALKTRLLGRRLAEDIYNSKNELIATRNQEINANLSVLIAKTKTAVLVRSPITCQEKDYVCQLCYGWSLATHRLVPSGEAVGIIAGQSIGEPGTQLTMRTFHTGGVFSGEVSEEIKAPIRGLVFFKTSIPGKLVRTMYGQMAFLTKQESFLFLNSETTGSEKHQTLPLDSNRLVDTKPLPLDSNKQKGVLKIPAYTLLFVKQNQLVEKDQILGEAFAFLAGQNQSIEAYETLYSDLSGEIRFQRAKGIRKKKNSLTPIPIDTTLKLNVRKSKKGKNIFNSSASTSMGEFWILSAQKQTLLEPTNLIVKPGDFLHQNAIIYLSKTAPVLGVSSHFLNQPASLGSINQTMQPTRYKLFFYDFGHFGALKALNQNFFCNLTSLTTKKIFKKGNAFLHPITFHKKKPNSIFVNPVLENHKFPNDLFSSLSQTKDALKQKDFVATLTRPFIAIDFQKRSFLNSNFLFTQVFSNKSLSLKSNFKNSGSTLQKQLKSIPFLFETKTQEMPSLEKKRNLAVLNSKLNTLKSLKLHQIGFSPLFKTPTGGFIGMKGDCHTTFESKFKISLIFLLSQVQLEKMRFVEFPDQTKPRFAVDALNYQFFEPFTSFNFLQIPPNPFFILGTFIKFRSNFFSTKFASHLWCKSLPCIIDARVGTGKRYFTPTYLLFDLTVKQTFSLTEKFPYPFASSETVRKFLQSPSKLHLRFTPVPWTYGPRAKVTLVALPYKGKKPLCLATKKLLNVKLSPKFVQAKISKLLVLKQIPLSSSFFSGHENNFEKKISKKNLTWFFARANTFYFENKKTYTQLKKSSFKTLPKTTDLLTVYFFSSNHFIGFKKRHFSKQLFRRKFIGKPLKEFYPCDSGPNTVKNRLNQKPILFPVTRKNNLVLKIGKGNNRTLKKTSQVFTNKLFRISKFWTTQAHDEFQNLLEKQTIPFLLSFSKKRKTLKQEFPLTHNLVPPIITRPNCFFWFSKEQGFLNQNFSIGTSLISPQKKNSLQPIFQSEPTLPFKLKGKSVFTRYANKFVPNVPHLRAKREAAQQRVNHFVNGTPPLLFSLIDYQILKNYKNRTPVLRANFTKPNLVNYSPVLNSFLKSAFFLNTGLIKKKILFAKLGILISNFNPPELLPSLILFGNSILKLSIPFSFFTRKNEKKYSNSIILVQKKQTGFLLKGSTILHTTFSTQPTLLSTQDPLIAVPTFLDFCLQRKSTEDRHFKNVFLTSWVQTKTDYEEFVEILKFQMESFIPQNAFFLSEKFLSCFDKANVFPTKRSSCLSLIVPDNLNYYQHLFNSPINCLVRKKILKKQEQLFYTFSLSKCQTTFLKFPKANLKFADYMVENKKLHFLFSKIVLNPKKRGLQNKKWSFLSFLINSTFFLNFDKNRVFESQSMGRKGQTSQVLSLPRLSNRNRLNPFSLWLLPCTQGARPRSNLLLLKQPYKLLSGKAKPTREKEKSSKLNRQKHLTLVKSKPLIAKKISQFSKTFFNHDQVLIVRKQIKNLKSQNAKTFPKNIHNSNLLLTSYPGWLFTTVYSQKAFAKHNCIQLPGNFIIDDIAFGNYVTFTRFLPIRFKNSFYQLQTNLDFWLKTVKIFCFDFSSPTKITFLFPTTGGNRQQGERQSTFVPNSSQSKRGGTWDGTMEEPNALLKNSCFSHVVVKNSSGNGVGHEKQIFSFFLAKSKKSPRLRTRSFSPAKQLFTKDEKFLFEERFLTASDLEKFEFFFNSIKTNLIDFHFCSDEKVFQKRVFFKQAAKKQMKTNLSSLANGCFTCRGPGKKLFIIHPSSILKSRLEKSLKKVSYSKFHFLTEQQNRILSTVFEGIKTKVQKKDKTFLSSSNNLSFFDKTHLVSSYNKKVSLFKKVLILKKFLLFFYTGLTVFSGKLELTSRNNKTPCFSNFPLKNQKLGEENLYFNKQNLLPTKGEPFCLAQPVPGQKIWTPAKSKIQNCKNAALYFYNSHFWLERQLFLTLLQSSTVHVEKKNDYSKEICKEKNTHFLPESRFLLVPIKAGVEKLIMGMGFQKEVMTSKLELTCQHQVTNSWCYKSTDKKTNCQLKIFSAQVSQPTYQQTSQKPASEIYKNNKQVINNYCRLTNFKTLKFPGFFDEIFMNYSFFKFVPSLLKMNSFLLEKLNKTNARLPLLKPLAFQFNKNARFKPKLLILGKTNNSLGLNSGETKADTFATEPLVQGVLSFESQKTFSFFSAVNQTLFFTQKATQYLIGSSKNYKKKMYQLLDTSNLVKQNVLDDSASAKSEIKALRNQILFAKNSRVTKLFRLTNAVGKGGSSSLNPCFLQKKQTASKFLEYQIQPILQLQWTFFNSSLFKKQKSNFTVALKAKVKFFPSRYTKTKKWIQYYRTGRGQNLKIRDLEPKEIRIDFFDNGKRKFYPTNFKNLELSFKNLEISKTPSIEKTIPGFNFLKNSQTPHIQGVLENISQKKFNRPYSRSSIVRCFSHKRAINLFQFHLNIPEPVGNPLAFLFLYYLNPVKKELFQHGFRKTSKYLLKSLYLKTESSENYRTNGISGISPLKGEVLFATETLPFKLVDLSVIKKSTPEIHLLTDVDLLSFEIQKPKHQKPTLLNDEMKQITKKKHGKEKLQVSVGEFVRYGKEIISNVGLNQSGQILILQSNKLVLRYAKPFLLSSGGICNLVQGDFITYQAPLLTLKYKTLKTEDIVQGIPKIEQLFEARQNLEKESGIPYLLRNKFLFYKDLYPKKEAVQKSIEYIQHYIIDGIQTVYQSQGVTISDKHIEIIVKQMTCKVKILEPGASGLLRGDIVYLHVIELANYEIHRNNISYEGFRIDKKAEYEPMVLGITKAALTIRGFISAASFQETIKTLTKAAIFRRRDFLRGLKENVILGHLIPSGTGASPFTTGGV